jgi:two-component system sensor histidine kinase RegB
MALPWSALLGVLALLTLLAATTQIRLSRPWAVGHGELVAQLLADLGGLAALLFFSGGWMNPFVSMLLLPVVLAAITLRPAATWLLAAAALGLYTGLAFFHVPLPHEQAHSFELHLTGMWFNFAISLLIVTVFVVRLRHALAAQETALTRAREERLRDERLLALGLQAAGAAHELATPLNSIALLADALRGQTGPGGVADADALQTQVQRCKRLLTRLSGRVADADGTRRLTAAAYVDELAEEWRLLRPAVPLHCIWEGAAPPVIACGLTLDQAVLNLMNNAADASPQGLELRGGTQGDELLLEVLDRGPGLDERVLRQAGTMALPGKPDGLGLGLLLTNASIERLGGTVRMSNREGGGARASIHLPLAALAAPA